LDWIIDNGDLNVTRCCGDCGMVFEDYFISEVSHYVRNVAREVRTRVWIAKKFSILVCNSLRSTNTNMDTKYIDTDNNLKK